MTIITDLSVLIRNYSNRIDSPIILFIELVDYLFKYARRYVEEAPDLVIWLNDTSNVLKKELEELIEDGKVVLLPDNQGNNQIFVPQYFIDRFSQRYKDIDENKEIPYPLANELHANYPSTLIHSISLSEDFTNLLVKDEFNINIMYQLNFPTDDLPPIIYPGTLRHSRLLSFSLAKVRLFLVKDESRDYIQKRIMSASPGKELSVKNFVTQVQTRPTESYQSIKSSGEDFVFWSYLCTFIKQDFYKKTEKTLEDISLLQSVAIIEYLNNYYKTKIQEELQRETALKNLDLEFQKAPYYFSMDDIVKFTDSRGVPLLGQYKDSDLNEYIKTKTNDGDLHSLPHLLVFKTSSDNRFFVLKEKIYALILRLCNEARDTIKEKIVSDWKNILSKFRQEEAMNNQIAYENKIEAFCKTYAPVLYSVLNASFIPLLAMQDSGDKKEHSGFTVFSHGRLIPFSELLMLNRGELLTDAKILLPFWYSIPIISSIIYFFRRPKKSKQTKKEKNIEKKIEKPEIINNQENKNNRKNELKNKASSLEKKLVPSGSNLENELKVYLERWNISLDKQAKENLTDDVNSLIRDYIRRVFRTIKVSSFDEERIKNLAANLVDTQNLMKIKNKNALLKYTQLYILYLIKHMK